MRKLFIEERGSVIVLDELRADYIHEDRYASLGQAVLYRSPLAFLCDADRVTVHGDEARMLPLALSLAEAATMLQEVTS